VTAGGVAPNEFETGEVVCEGDSGGPALDSQTGAIIGVVSRGGNGLPQDPNDPSANCLGARNLYTQVSPFKDLILEAFSAAGATPWLEGQPNPSAAPFGGACSQPSDCQSNQCLGGGDGGAGVCTADCSMAACPAGYDCRKSDNLCVVHVAPPPRSGCALVGPAADTGGAWLLFVVLALALLLRRRRAALS
jgi:MYXO-CTERM domain-containing protein